MLEISLGFSLIALLFTILNNFSLITPRIAEQVKEKISVLVPLRNEEENAVAIIETWPLKRIYLMSNFLSLTIIQLIKPMN